jgi:hypothetical protein
MNAITKATGIGLVVGSLVGCNTASTQQQAYEQLVNKTYAELSDHIQESPLDMHRSFGTSQGSLYRRFYYATVTKANPDVLTVKISPYDGSCADVEYDVNPSTDQIVSRKQQELVYMRLHGPTYCEVITSTDPDTKENREAVRRALTAIDRQGK